MTRPVEMIEILVVDDDPEVVRQLQQLVPDNISGQPVAWEWSEDFDAALNLLRRRRFDVLVSDIYRGRDVAQKNIAQGDQRARDLVEEIRSRRFCPIVLYTDGTRPEDLVSRPFVWFADKAAGDFDAQLRDRVAAALATGLPSIARRLHDELDRFAGSYVWQFLASHWQTLRDRHGLDEEALERVIRRRAALQLGRLDADGADVVERTTSDPVDYYLYPPVVSDVRLGEIVRRKATSEFRVILTPHCFLARQPGQNAPRATHVLTARTVAAADIRDKWKWDKNPEVAKDQLRRRTSLQSERVGPPDGRYCFLPAFLDIPDLYCDLFQIESIGYQSLLDDFERIAVLDTPYAEALQVSLSRLYGAVGLPLLNLERVAHLGAGDDAQPAGA